MIKLCNVFFISCSIVFSVMADMEISLNGNVKDGKGTPIVDATVTLASDTTKKTVTDVNGEFSINNILSIYRSQNSSILFNNINNITVRGNKLEFSLVSLCNNGSIKIFSSDGKRSSTITTGRMKSGKQKILLPKLAAGCYLMVITTEQIATTIKLVNTGKEIFISAGNSSVKSTPGIFQNNAILTKVVDSLSVQKENFKPMKEAITSYNQSGISIIMDNTKSPAISVKNMPVITELPDPLTMNDGTKVTNADQWKLRRREMIRIFEDYEYGHMPPSPGNVTASVATPQSRITVSGQLQADYRMMRLKFGPDQKLGFDMGVFTPVSSDDTKKYPVLIALSYNAGKSSLMDASAALSRGYAVATVPYNQLGEDSKNWQKTGFFSAYPEYDWRDFSAWAWGISRAIDYLVTDSLIDGEKVMATGASRLGQAVLLAGAFDERIALSAPVAGGMAFRFSGKEMGGGLGQGITEIVDQNTYWFGPLLPQFKNQTTKLPCDQHWLPALTAPRLFIMCNSLKDEYGRAYAAVQTYLGAKPVYELLGVEENLGVNFRAGGHGMYAEDWSALLDFADQKLLKKGGTRRFDVIPSEDKIP